MPVRIISKNFILLGILLLFLLMASGCSAAPANRDFRISRYEQTVLLQPDGGAVVTETIHYKMLSRSSEFLFEIRPATDEGVRIMQVDIAAMAEGGDREKDKFLIVREGKPSDSQAGAPYYRTDRTGDRIHVRVMVLSDAGQDRTIRLTYQLEQAVLLATDTAFLVGNTSSTTAAPMWRRLCWH